MCASSSPYYVTIRYIFLATLSPPNVVANFIHMRSLSTLIIVAWLISVSIWLLLKQGSRAVIE